MSRHAVGVDIGGTGVKAAPVDVETGRLLQSRIRVLTPHPATPEAVIKTTADILAQIDVPGPVGIAFPAAVKDGMTLSAANVDPAWINFDASRGFRLGLNRPVTVLNDADAAGIAEVRFGAAADQKGTVIVLTLGTGIGCALFSDGVLFPNTELGHLIIRGKDAERRASATAREMRGYTWKKWARILSEYLTTLERLFYPDLFVIGGGAAKSADKFLNLLDVRTKVVTATLGNDAGIVGAALAVSRMPRLLGPEDEAQAEGKQKEAKTALQHGVAGLQANSGAKEHSHKES